MSEEITDEMVEAACASFIPNWHRCSVEVQQNCRKDMRAALTAALSRAPQTGAAPEGMRLMPEKPTPQMRNALRVGSFADVPSDTLCDIRYAALLHAALPTQPKESDGGQDAA